MKREHEANANLELCQHEIERLRAVIVGKRALIRELRRQVRELTRKLAEANRELTRKLAGGKT